ncbi:hypothetical protein [Microbacterium sp. A20]|nr:hypothetical protein [Microbacterium sp. A20]
MTLDEQFATLSLGLVWAAEGAMAGPEMGCAVLRGVRGNHDEIRSFRD